MPAPNGNRRPWGDSSASAWAKRDTEVENLHLRLACDDQILRLDVAVNHPFLGGMLKPERNLAGQHGGEPHRQRTFLRDKPVETDPLDELHHEKERSTRFPRVVRGDDVMMLQLGRGANLLLEAGDGVGFRGQVRRDHLDRDDAAHQQILGLVDRPHASRAKLVDDAVARVIDEPGRNLFIGAGGEKGRGRPAGLDRVRFGRGGAGQIRKRVLRHELELAAACFACPHVPGDHGQFVSREVAASECGQCFRLGTSRSGHSAPILPTKQPRLTFKMARKMQNCLPCISPWLVFHCLSDGSSGLA